VCNSCNKEIVQPQDLQEHFVEDKNTGKYVCNYCNEQLSNFMTLIQHITRLHGNDGNYQCGLCQELESTEPTGVQVLDMFVVFVMLCLMFPENLKIT
jgi:DNA-directed RNA polymerase subunit RPC12/RpoP